MSNPPKNEFLDGPGIDACLAALHDAIAASVQQLGGIGVKSFAVLVRSDLGVGVVTDGCTCPRCQIEMMRAFAEAHGATASLVVDGQPEDAVPVVLHS